MVTDLAAYLVAKGLGTLGTDLFLGALPELPVDATALHEAPGLPTARVFGGILWERPRVRVLVRSAAYLDGRQQAEAVRQALAVVRGPLGYATYINAETGPVALGDRDDHDRPVFSFMAEFEKQLSALPAALAASATATATAEATL